MGEPQNIARRLRELHSPGDPALFSLSVRSNEVTTQVERPRDSGFWMSEEGEDPICVSTLLVSSAIWSYSNPYPPEHSVLSDNESVCNKPLTQMAPVHKLQGKQVKTEEKIKGDWIPAKNESGRHLFIKRELAGTVRVPICQTHAGDKGNEGADPGPSSPSLNRQTPPQAPEDPGVSTNGGKAADPLRLRRDGPSYAGDLGARRFGSTGPGCDPRSAELARPWLYLRVIDYRCSARPQSGSCSSPAASGAHGYTAGTPGQCSSRRYRPRPSNCRHAPDDRFCHAPNHGNRLFIGQFSRFSTCPARSLRLGGDPLISEAVPQSGGGILRGELLSNWLHLTALVQGPRRYWIRPARSGRGKGRRARRWVVFDVDGGGVKRRVIVTANCFRGLGVKFEVISRERGRSVVSHRTRRRGKDVEAAVYGLFQLRTGDGDALGNTGLSYCPTVLSTLNQPSWRPPGRM
ncbi:uncharacterized protein LOC124903573 [Homo sapiens]|uniref:uncharacterized protein LOC124903573 n=1 Tax=Homo sapiens TaxID=9606 RepID=UPI001FB0D364|nr:uncharacterized protein LOC124903573 [Homo sapiens]